MNQLVSLEFMFKILLRQLSKLKEIKNKQIGDKIQKRFFDKFPIYWLII